MVQKTYQLRQSFTSNTVNCCFSTIKTQKLKTIFNAGQEKINSTKQEAPPLPLHPQLIKLPSGSSWCVPHSKMKQTVHTIWEENNKSSYITQNDGIETSVLMVLKTYIYQIQYVSDCVYSVWALYSKCKFNHISSNTECSMLWIHL